jgi:hypothetical protein
MAIEYSRLDGRRLAKVGDIIVSTRAWDNEPAEASTFWIAHIEPLDKKSQREVILHLPFIIAPVQNLESGYE